MKAIKEIQVIYEDYQYQTRVGTGLWQGEDTDLDAVIRLCQITVRKINNVAYLSRRSSNTQFAKRIAHYLVKEITDEQAHAERLKIKWGR